LSAPRLGPALLLLAFCAGLASCRRAGGGPDEEPALVMEDEDADLPAQAALALQLNRRQEVELPQGGHLILTVRVTNPRATMAASANETQGALLAEVATRQADGHIDPARAATLRKRLERERHVYPLQLGDGGGWGPWLRVELHGPGGSRQLPLRLVSGDAAARALGPDDVATLEFVLDAPGTAAIAAGNYQLVARLEAPAGARLPAESWAGTASSDTARLRILQPQDPGTPAQREGWALDQGDAFLVLGQPAEALTRAQAVLAANPRSIPALILAVDALRQLGEPAQALQHCFAALREFYQQYPDSYEAPLALQHRMRELQAALAQ
jgi:hypothetical protein